MKRLSKYFPSLVGILLFFSLISLFSCEARTSDEIILEAYQNRRSGFFVESTGLVERILNDDLKGARHQRFIVRLANGQTLLIAHNIDIAKRIKDIKIGDRIYFRGQYEWNDKGGLIHWTHRDPGGLKQGGWIEHNAQRYY